jgi:hypothetical protein
MTGKNESRKGGQTKKAGKEQHYRNRKKMVLAKLSLLSFDTTRTQEQTTPPTILPYRRNNFTELLPSRDRGAFY